MEAHSTYSASAFEAAMLCPGKPVLERGIADGGSTYAREGTAAHRLLEWCVTNSQRADAYAGRIIEVEGDRFEVDPEMVDAINWCLDQVEAYAGGNAVMAETRVNYSRWLGVPEDQAWGTADVIIPRDDGELVVLDLKYGRGVEVDAERNPQMMLYGLGALNAVDGLLGDFDRARLVVLQPRLRRAPSEWACTTNFLKDWAETDAQTAVDRRVEADANRDHVDDWARAYLNPGEKQCRFCKAKAACPALRDEVAGTVFDAVPASPDDFIDAVPTGAGYATDADWLAAALLKVDAIEEWCKSVRAEAERRLLAGDPVPGFKLVEGKRGARQWSDPKEAEKLLRETFRLPVEKAFDLKLISPTSAEKLAKAGDIGPRQWPRAQALIVQAAGKPHVAPDSDPRPALVRQPVAEQFDPADDIA